MLDEFKLKSSDIMLSGGAEGADTVFGKAAEKAGHQVVHWSFPKHKSKLKSNLVQLTEDHLVSVDPYIIRANKSIIRKFPTNSNYTNNLLRRNYYQVRWSESVYAVSKFDDNSKSLLKVDGGTAWACQMYADRFLYDREDWSICKMYLYDMISNEWYQ